MLLAGNGFGTIWIICCHFPKTPLNSGTAYNKKLHQEHVSKTTFYDQGIGKQRDIRDGLSDSSYTGSDLTNYKFLDLDDQLKLPYALHSQQCAILDFTHRARLK